MGQRLMTDRLRRVLGVTASGYLIPVVMGAEPDDPNKRKKDDEEDGGSGAGGDDSGSEGDDGGSGTDDEDLTGKSLYTQSDVEKFINRMKAADQRAAKFEKQIKDGELAQKSEVEQARIKLQEAQQEIKAAKEELTKSRIHNAFLASNKYTWHDPEVALKLLDIEDIQIGDDGKVTGVAEAAEALAKAKPFLIKADSGDSGKSKEKPGGGKPSGSQPPANNSNNTRDKDRAALLQKYPSLGRGR